jgi:hypothetical protein
MSQETLSYGSSAPAAPGLMRVAFWLLVVSAIASVVLPVAYYWMIRLLAPRGVDSVESRGVAIIATYCAVFTAVSVICAIGVSQRRWRAITRGLAIFPLCLFVPMGTIAGLFTYVILGRPTIRAVYQHESRI